VEKINEMRFVMRKAISLDEEAVIKEEALLSRLWTENKVKMNCFVFYFFLDNTRLM